MESDKIPLLSICIPTRNGGDTVVNNVANILKCTDERFIIHVNNNSSTDDTLCRLQKIADGDKRLKITSNQSCVLAYENFNQVLTRAEAKYIYIIIDKETLNPNYIVEFLDILEKEKPLFGYVNYSRRRKNKIIKHSAGLEAIKNISHFGNTHTTGFFYKKELYLSENDFLLKFTNGGNWWITDLTSFSLGFRHDAMTINIPLNVFNYQDVLGGVSKSKFTKENLYFYGRQRCVDYKMFLELALVKDSTIKVLPIINALNKRYITLVTYLQKRYFKDKQRCAHYGAESRDVTIKEMFFWCKELLAILSEESKKYSLPISYVNYWIYSVKCIIKGKILGSTFGQKIWAIIIVAYRKIVYKP